MARSLVIVESPAKAKTINKYLGRNFTVKASIGHVMDLPKKTIGIRLPGEEEGGKKKKKSKAKVIHDLRKAAQSADAIYLAGDPDREGEAISAHLAMVLSKPSKFIEQEPSVSRFKKK